MAACAVKYAHNPINLFFPLNLPGDRIVTHPTDAADSGLESANTKSDYQVSRADLPLSCPTAEQKIWNSHPRVYLPIEQTGSASCPYCGARYRLVD
jgi:uncharacterized Zn-finger protein